MATAADKGQTKPADKAGDSDPAAVATAAAAPPAAGAAPPPAEPAASCGALSDIPDIPSDTSTPPSLAEWGQACDINTQGANSHAPDCTTKIMREWLQVTCRGDIIGTEHQEGFGRLNQDYYELINLPDMASYVIRLRKGRSQKIRICREKERASLFVSWPPASAKPTIVALAIGPKCDGKEWGSGFKPKSR